MKPTSILVGAFAALVAAAPTEKVERGNNDFSNINNFAFQNQDLNYLGVVNQLDVALLSQLGSFNNLNLGQFGNIFNGNQFNLNSILQLQQLFLVQQLAQVGVFSNFDLSSLVFNSLNLGLVNNIGGFDFNSIIDQSLAPQIAQVIATGVVAIKE